MNTYKSRISFSSEFLSLLIISAQFFPCIEPEPEQCWRTNTKENMCDRTLFCAFSSTCREDHYYFQRDRNEKRDSHWHKLSILHSIDALVALKIIVREKNILSPSLFFCQLPSRPYPVFLCSIVDHLTNLPRKSENAEQKAISLSSLVKSWNRQVFLTSRQRPADSSGYYSFSSFFILQLPAR